MLLVKLQNSTISCPVSCPATSATSIPSSPLQPLPRPLICCSYTLSCALFLLIFFFNHHSDILWHGWPISQCCFLKRYNCVFPCHWDVFENSFPWGDRICCPHDRWPLEATVCSEELWKSDKIISFKLPFACMLLFFESPVIKVF